jgi:hypothetical protein
VQVKNIDALGFESCVYSWYTSLHGSKYYCLFKAAVHSQRKSLSGNDGQSFEAENIEE